MDLRSVLTNDGKLVLDAGWYISEINRAIGEVHDHIFDLEFDNYLGDLERVSKRAVNLVLALFVNLGHSFGLNVEYRTLLKFLHELDADYIEILLVSDEKWERDHGRRLARDEHDRFLKWKMSTMVEDGEDEPTWLGDEYCLIKKMVKRVPIKYDGGFCWWWDRVWFVEQRKQQFGAFLLGKHERSKSPIVLLYEDVLELILISLVNE